MFNFSNKNNEEKTGIILFALGLIFLFISTFVGFTKFGIWNDEFFSLYIVNLPLKDLVIRATTDVHPILFYLIYKSFIKLLSSIASDIIIGRIVSLLPIYLIAILSVTKIRERFGFLTAGIFFLCISCMPQMMIFSLEIRMYSWALFFVTASVFYAYEIVNGSNLKNWMILTILTICSLNTHYFSAIASGVIYLFLLIYFIISNKSSIKNWLISTVLVIIGFLPWAFVVLGQIDNLNGGFWIKPITIHTMISYVFYVLSPAEIFIKDNELLHPTILGVLMIISFVILIYKIRDKFALSCIIGFILIPIIGIILSKVFFPIFHPRYMVPALGALWLGFSILLAKSFEDKKVFIPILLLVLVIGVIGTVDFINVQDDEILLYSNEINGLNKVIGPDDIVICGSHKFRFSVENYYLNGNIIYCFEENLNENITNLLNNSTIQSKLNNGSKLYYINYPKYDNISGTNLKINKIPYNGTILENEIVIYEILV